MNSYPYEVRAVFCTNNISKLTKRQRLVGMYLHTTPLVFWYMGLHRISKHTEQMNQRVSGCNRDKRMCSLFCAKTSFRSASH